MSNNSRTGFGRYLARLMVARGFETAGQLATAVGVDRSLVSRWLNNDHQVSVEHLRKLAVVLDEPVLEMLIRAGHLERHEVMNSFRRMTADEKSPA